MAGRWARRDDRVRRAVGGTGLLAIAVVGSGIHAPRLSPGDTGLRHFDNAAATGTVIANVMSSEPAVTWSGRGRADDRKGATNSIRDETRSTAASARSLRPLP